jgi:hypothetical protein
VCVCVCVCVYIYIYIYIYIYTRMSNVGLSVLHGIHCSYNDT